MRIFHSIIHDTRQILHQRGAPVSVGVPRDEVHRLKGDSSCWTRVICRNPHLDYARIVETEKEQAHQLYVFIGDPQTIEKR